MKTTPNNINVRWCPKCPGMTQHILECEACPFCKGPTYVRNVVDHEDMDRIIVALLASAEAWRAKCEQERASVVRYLRVWADSNRDNEAIDGRLQALVTDTHANNIERGEHHSRPAADDAARPDEPGGGEL